MTSSFLWLLVLGSVLGLLLLGSMRAFVRSISFVRSFIRFDTYISKVRYTGRQVGRQAGTQAGRQADTQPKGTEHGRRIEGVSN